MVVNEKIDASRKQIVEGLGGRRIRLRRISFAAFGGGGAYVLAVEDDGEWVEHSSNRVYTRAYLDRHREVLDLMRDVKDKLTYGGCLIL